MTKQKNEITKTEKELLQELNLKIDKLIAIFGISGNLDKSHLNKLSKAGFKLSEMQSFTGIDQSDISKILRGVKKINKKKENSVTKAEEEK